MSDGDGLEELGWKTEVRCLLGCLLLAGLAGGAALASAAYWFVGVFR